MRLASKVIKENADLWDGNFEQNEENGNVHNYWGSGDKQKYLPLVCGNANLSKDQ